MPKGPSHTFFDLGINRNQREYALRDVPVTGHFPEWLKGNYIRNGPGAFHLNGKRLNHWFDGMGALHSFNIRHSKVDYICKFIDCGSYRYANEHHALRYSEFATDPCRSIFKKVQSYVFPTLPNMTDNPKIHVAKIGNRYRALGETPMQVEFDPETLERTGVQELVPGGFAYKTTAHPHFDGEHAYNLVVKFGMQSYYRIYDMLNNRKPLCSIPIAKPAYLHGFGMSRRYFIIAAGPLVVVPIHLLFWKKPYIENHRWLPGEGGMVWVIDRSTGAVTARFETEPFFSFHHINAWEAGEELIMDINAYDDASIIQHYYLRELENPDLRLPKGTVRRYRMNLRTRTYQAEKIAEACIELPRIDYQRFNTEGNYQQVYGVSVHPEHPTGFYNSLVKINTHNGKEQYWYQEGQYPGEPCFIPKPGSRKDDDGVVLSIVLDSLKGNSYLMALDAATLQEIGRATVPEPVVYGFHADFFPNEKHT